MDTNTLHKLTQIWVNDLFDLRNPSINLVLFRLESVQSNIGIIQSGKGGDADELLALEAQEVLLQYMIQELWRLNCGGHNA